MSNPPESLPVTIARFFDWGRSGTAHMFTSSPEANVWAAAPKKSHPDLFNALESASKALAAHYFDGPGRKPVTGGGLAEGYKLVEKRVALRGDVSWSDLLQMRRSRSIYLGRKVPGGYITQIPVTEKPEFHSLSILPLAKSVTLTDKTVEIELEGQEKNLVLPADHALYKSLLDFAEAMKKRGLNPAEINIGKGSPLPFKDETGNHGFEVPQNEEPVRSAVDELGDQSEGPSPQEEADLAASEMSGEEHDYSATPVDEENFSEQHDSSAPADSAPAGGEAPAQSPKAAATAVAAQAKPLEKDELEVLQSPMVRIGDKVVEVSDLAHVALKNFQATAPDTRIKVLKKSSVGTFTTIWEIRIADRQIDLSASIELAATNAGVPTKESLPQLTPDQKLDRVQQLAKELVVVASTPLDKLDQLPQLESSTPEVTTDSGRNLPMAPTGIPRPKSFDIDSP